MARGFFCGLMGTNMKVPLKRAVETVQENLPLQVENFMKENSLLICLKELASAKALMGVCTKESGRVEAGMEKEFRYMRMEASTLESGSKTRDTEAEFQNTATAENTKENSHQEPSGETESKPGLTDAVTKDLFSSEYPKKKEFALAPTAGSTSESGSTTGSMELAFLSMLKMGSMELDNSS